MLLFRFAARRAVILGAIAIAGSTFASPAAADDGSQFPARVLAAHNSARASAGMRPLQWDRQLGSEAARYALQLAISGMFAHSAPDSRGDAGENLWMGTRGAFSPSAMVGGWISERRFFTPGMFPTVSRTGNWRDVGHYTQMVWPMTQRVGCALATNARYDYLVCRYWPAGNVLGVTVRPAAIELARQR